MYMSKAKQLLRKISKLEETYAVNKVVFPDKPDSKSVIYKFSNESDARGFVDNLPSNLKSELKSIRLINLGNPVNSVTAIGYPSTNFDKFEKDAGLSIKNVRIEHNG